MFKEFQQSKQSNLVGAEGKMNEGLDDLKVIDLPDLALGQAFSILSKRQNSSSDVNNRKRKQICDGRSIDESHFELQVDGRLPLDWEQCLDLQSGRMYYTNKKSQRRTWIGPKEQHLDLDLNISSSGGNTNPTLEEPKMQHNSSGDMVAVSCTNCSLLVMLCKSFPACPNCRYVHSLQPSVQGAIPQNLEAAKTKETLNLLH